MLHTASPPRPLPRVRYAAFLALPLLVGVLTGCSGSASGGSAPSAAGTEQSAQDWMVSFSACMRDEGIADYPDPNADGSMSANMSLDEGDAEKLEVASEACMKNLGEPPAGPGGKLSDEDRLKEGLKIAKCFRDNGYDMEDPKDGGLMIPEAPQEVMEKCFPETGGAPSVKRG